MSLSTPIVIDGATPMDTLCAFYGLPVPPDAPTDVATWMREELRRPAVEGDSAMLGSAEISVRPFPASDAKP